MHADDKPTLLVSACLLGTCCNHEGKGSPRPGVVALAATHRIVPICPEVIGGLPSPREAAEIPGGDGEAVLDGAATVRTEAGADVTAAYLRGADEAVTLAVVTGARRAVLKTRSPSCGSSVIFDGTFSQSLRAGAGVTAAALRRAGVQVVSEEDVLDS